MRGSPLGDAVVSGGVGQAILPHRTEMEKVCPLNAVGGVTLFGCGGVTDRKPEYFASTDPEANGLHLQHSEDTTFPFLAFLYGQGGVMNL